MRPMMVLLPGPRLSGGTGSGGGGGGGGSGTVSISDTGASQTVSSPASATAYYELQNDGDVMTSSGAGSDWLIGSVTGSDYECRATIVSGTLSTGTTGSWLALSSHRSWTVTRSSLGSKSCTFDLEIGLVGTSTALDTARIFLTATVELPE
jgi:hypothetical protein